MISSVLAGLHKTARPITYSRKSILPSWFCDRMGEINQQAHYLNYHSSQPTQRSSGMPCSSISSCTGPSWRKVHTEMEWQASGPPIPNPEGKKFCLAINTNMFSLRPFRVILQHPLWVLEPSPDGRPSGRQKDFHPRWEGSIHFIIGGSPATMANINRSLKGH